MARCSARTASLAASTSRPSGRCRPGGPRAARWSGRRRRRSGAAGSAAWPTRRARRRRALVAGSAAARCSWRRGCGRSARRGGPARRAPGSPCAASSRTRRPAPFGELADLGPAEQPGRRWRCGPSASVQPDGRVAEPGDRARVVCHGVEAVRPERGGQLERQRGRGGRPGRRGRRRARRSRPGCRRRRRPGPGGPSAAGGVVRVEDAGQPVRRLQPERGGHGVLGEGAAGHRRPAVALGELGQQRDLRASSAPTSPMASRAQSISAVSRTSWLVRPRCSHRAPSALVLEPRRAAARRARRPGCPSPRPRCPATRGGRA